MVRRKMRVVPEPAEGAYAQQLGRIDLGQTVLCPVLVSVFKPHQSSPLVPFCPSTSWDTVRTGQCMHCLQSSGCGVDELTRQHIEGYGNSRLVRVEGQRAVPHVGGKQHQRAERGFHGSPGRQVEP